MARELNINFIPGTRLDIKKMDGAIGADFLNKVFYITNGIMLAQVREITGLDTTTMQNWVKRNWVPHPINKMYDKNHLARILIINMMRDTMQISRVAYIIAYVSSTDGSDSIISESELYDYLCKVIVKISSPDSAALNELSAAIDSVLADYTEPYVGAKRRLEEAIRIIVMTYYAALIKTNAETRLDMLGADPKRKR